MFKGIRQWLLDTYNGLYVIVLKPYMPSYVTVVAVVLALLFGLFWGYVAFPVRYYDGVPAQMSDAARDEWVKLVAGAKFAGMYPDNDIISLLRQVENPLATVDRLLGGMTDENVLSTGLQAIRPLAEQAQPGTPAPRPNPIWQDVLLFLGAVGLVILLALIISPVWALLIKPNIWDKFYDAVTPKSAAELERRRSEKENRDRIRQQKEDEEKMRVTTAAEASTNPYGAPVMQKLSIYTKGRSFDDSFAIEDANDMFLGECGATIAKNIGDTNEPAAIEIWLFDKDDFVRTLNKLFVSEHAFNDPVIRAELDNRVDDPVNDLIMIRAGSVITLQTGALLLQAKVLEMKYGENGVLPPNSYFETLRLQVETWQKAGGDASKIPVSAPMAVAAPIAAPILVPPAPSFAPPPTTPGTMPPPLPPRRQIDDDPFGGTGDFTPVGQ
ncbi:MAG: hypothetical protein H7Y11_08345 [Armatimonadetes bacterium]|nr:hypothetical protein [Anaerolineae bacterium]